MILLFRHYSFDAVFPKSRLLWAFKVNFNFIFPKAMNIVRVYGDL